jgi:putative phosphoribosyl transferase
LNLALFNIKIIEYFHACNRSVSTEQLTESKILFENRADAGRKLAAELAGYANQPCVILAIPNGGVPLAIEVARALKAELDFVVCRKLALPMNPEGGLGAVADDGTAVINQDVAERDGISADQIEFEVAQIKANIKLRTSKYRGESVAPRLTGKTAIIVDDGLASGITMAVAVESVRHRYPKQVVAAVPLASATGFKRASSAANRVVTCAVSSQLKFYLADFYRHWQDVSDAEVVRALEQWRKINTNI